MIEPAMKKINIKLNRQTVKELKEKLAIWWSGGKKGTISQKRVFYLAYRSLVSRKSRAMITISAIALGTAAIVFLVSFAYGLQDIVTKRIVQPKSMSMIDVVSGTTNLQLSQATVDEIAKIPNVAGISRAVSVAGVVGLNNSRMDTVVVAVDGNYFDYANPVVDTGKWMSKDALKESTYNDGQSLAGLMGKVAGASTDDMLTDVTIGQKIDGKIVSFRIDDDVYVPLRKAPKTNAEILGFVKGSVMNMYDGGLVWGSQYDSVDASGKAFLDQTGSWFGKWISTEVPIYQQTSPGFYEPLTDSQGQQTIAKGFMGLSGAKILTSIEKEVTEKLITETKAVGQVLGDSTTSANVALTFNGGSSTASAELMQTIEKNKQVTATASSGLAVLEIKKTDGHEALVSTAFVKALNLSKDDIIGKSLTLEYIITGSVLPLGLSGRVMTKPVDYKIVGVFLEDTKPVLITPLADLISIGVSRYNTVKVLANKPENLTTVREKIQLMGFTTSSIVDTLAQVQKLFTILRFVLGAFGVIALVVALFGMFNTLTISLMERTRELGVMKTLGTTDRDVFRLFMAESLIIGAVGGAIGILIGVIGGQIINVVNALMRGGFSNSMFKTPFGFMVGVFALALLVGTATGFYPSKRAIKINPLDALRYE